MKRMLNAYLLKDSNTVVTQKSFVENVTDSDFTEISLIISMEEIQEWAEEIEMLGIDEEE